MATILDLLGAAFQYHRAGQRKQAEELYRKILQQESSNVDALHLLGILCQETGRGTESLIYLREAVRLMPDFVEGHYNLAKVLVDQGLLQDAIPSYEQAVRLKPEYAEAHFNLANLHRDLGQFASACASFRLAIQHRPGYTKAYINFGSLLQDLGQVDEAIDCYKTALHLQPNDPQVSSILAEIYAKQGKRDEAQIHFEVGQRRMSGIAKRQLDESRGLLTEGRLLESLAKLDEGVALDPQDADLWNSRALVQRELGLAVEAIASSTEALRLRPDFPWAHLNRAMARLSLGDYSQGWPEYDSRFGCSEFLAKNFTQPAWDGRPLQGRRILLYAEQGFGDTIQFVRFAPLVKQLGGRVTVMCHRALVNLLKSCPGVDLVVPEDEPAPDFDIQAGFMSLPGLLGTTLTNLPAKIPYLTPPKERVDAWQDELALLSGRRVGIVWQGNPSHVKDRHRSVSPEAFAPLAQIDSVRLLSLQKGPGMEKLANFAEHYPILDLGSRLDPDFQDTAALIKNLDLVVTIDTAIAHLAGALGVPVWVAIPDAMDWRWLLKREDSPWYPSMRLFRVQPWGNWEPCFERIAKELQVLPRIRES